MSDKRGHFRWRYSLRTLLLSIVGLSIVLAATLTTGQPRVMFRFRDRNGADAAVFAHHYGWPLPYLRVPSGKYAGKIPPDWFAPGLIVDLAVAGALIAVILAVAAVLKRATSRRELRNRSQSHADQCRC